MDHGTAGYDLGLAGIRDARSGRASSFDQRGRNQDGWAIGPGETRVLADLEGPGAIRHIFMTSFCRRVMGPGMVDAFATGLPAPMADINNALGMNWEVGDPDYYRKVLLRMTWDDEPEPAVLVPLGDFFGVGHSCPATYHSALFSVSAKPEEALHFGGSAALNCFAPMPFARHARVEVVNEGDLPYWQYFHIDYELYRGRLPDNVGYFHARWRRDDPCDGWAPDLQVNSAEVNIPNLDGARNYTVLDTAGRGHYLGCNLSVFHRQGTWWGEGDDMIFIDDDRWPPSLHGTGTEDYFTHAWGMQRTASLYGGSILNEADMPGYSVSYRLHVPDPIHFASRIRVTIEHGHANQLADDWASTAYWYQAPPSPKASILPLARRLPHRPEPATAPQPAPPLAGVEAECAANRAAYRARDRRYRKRLQGRLAERLALTDAWEKGNLEAARSLRERFK